MYGPPPCNSSVSRHRAFALRLPPTFSDLRPMADFRHTVLTVSVHPCAHRAVRDGFLTHFLLNCRLTQRVFTADSHTTSPDLFTYAGTLSDRFSIHHLPPLVNGLDTAKKRSSEPSPDDLFFINNPRSATASAPSAAAAPAPALHSRCRRPRFPDAAWPPGHRSPSAATPGRPGGR